MKEDSLKEIVSALLAAPVYSLDLETTSTKPLEATIVGMSLSVGDRTWWIPTGAEISLPVLHEYMRPVFADPAKICVMHNARYDLECLKVAGIEVFNRVADTMVALWLLDSTRAGTTKLGLKVAVLELLGHKMTRFEETALSGDLFGKDTEEYAIDDALQTFRLWKLLEKKMAEADAADKTGKTKLTKAFWDLEMPMIPIIMEMELSGIAVNRDYLKVMEKSMGLELAELEKKVNTAVGHPLQISSPDQVRSFLFQKLGLQPTKQTPTGKASVDYETLLDFKGQHAAIDLILRHREQAKLLSTYVRPLLEFSDKYGDWRIHTEFWQTGTDLGRWSSRGGINLQNQPRGGGIKEAFVAEAGKVLVVADFSQLELRMAAHVSQDPDLIKAYVSGSDVHQQTADACGCDRYTGKTMNFANLYGCSPKKLASVLWLEGGRRVTVGQAVEWQDKFWRKYKGLRGYHALKLMQVKANDTIIKTIAGRVRDVKYMRGKADDVNAKFRVAVHFEISGSSADVMLISMRNVHREILQKRTQDKRWNEVKSLVQVHDELVLEVPEELASEVQSRVKWHMENCVKLRVPLISDCHIGKNWKEGKGK